VEPLIPVKTRKKDMRKQYLFAANWKMHFPFAQAIEFATSYYDDFVRLAKESKERIVICSSTEGLYPLTEIFKSTSVEIGAQNCSAHINGPFTGQTSAQSLQDIGCSCCIIGHSESRKELNETDELIAHKCIHLLDYDITPILCIGESETDYKEKKTLAVLEQQLSSVTKLIKSKGIFHSYLTLYIAYEPIWSIGTGKVAPIQYLEMIFSWIHEYLLKQELPVECKLMYGGSISSENIENLKQISLIDGFLVGKSSLDFQKFQKLVQ
jgi:triosephosphate isomerase (TIM)